MKNVNWKELFIDIIIDIVAGMIIAVGIYNFALNADFPVAGFSGIAIILYHLFGLPVGAGTIILNVPVAIFCYKFLGKVIFLKVHEIDDHFIITDGLRSTTVSGL